MSPGEERIQYWSEGPTTERSRAPGMWLGMLAGDCVLNQPQPSWWGALSEAGSQDDDPRGSGAALGDLRKLWSG